MKVMKTTYFQWGPEILLNLQCKRKPTSHQLDIESCVVPLIFRHPNEIIIKIWSTCIKYTFGHDIKVEI